MSHFLSSITLLQDLLADRPEKKNLHSFTPSSGRSVQCMAFWTLSEPYIALKEPGLNSLATSTSQGPADWCWPFHDSTAG